MSDLLGQAEALLGFSVDLEQKLSKGGLGGVGGVIDRFIELRGALDGVSTEQLEWAKNMTHELVATLQGVAEQLEQLEAIKRALPDSRGRRDARGCLRRRAARGAVDGHPVAVAGLELLTRPRDGGERDARLRDRGGLGNEPAFLFSRWLDRGSAVSVPVSQLASPAPAPAHAQPRARRRIDDIDETSTLASPPTSVRACSFERFGVSSVAPALQSVAACVAERSEGPSGDCSPSRSSSPARRTLGPLRASMRSCSSTRCPARPATASTCDAMAERTTIRSTSAIAPPTPMVSCRTPCRH